MRSLGFTGAAGATREAHWGLACLLALLLATAGCGGCGDERPNAGEESGESFPIVIYSTPEPEAPPTPEKTRKPGLTAIIDSGSQRVEGSYDGVRFTAELVDAGQARARFESDEGALLAVDIRGPRSGALEWNGATIDGKGAPTGPEIELLKDLHAKLSTTTLALIALDLACEPEAETLDPAVGAALLLPFQMQLYYRLPPAEVESAIRGAALRSRCQHFRRPTEAIDPERSPASSIVALDAEQPGPVAYGYFPFSFRGERE